MRETEICALLSGLLPAGRENACFEADAEVFHFPGGRSLFSTDEFSGEDQFPETEPRLLGWNIAVATISDIWACGGTPRFYAHALTVHPEWDRAFLTDFGCGVRDALVECGATFLGGDVGRGMEWRCCGSILGTAGTRVITRKGASADDAIYVTGALGLGNAYAAAKCLGFRSGGEDWPRFKMRKPESHLVARYASACIDTSDGLWNGATILADMNGLGYRLENLPYLPAASDQARRAGFPRVALLFGECGEYELLFTVPTDQEQALQDDASRAGCELFRIGRMSRGDKLLEDDGQTFDLTEFDVRARDFGTVAEYLQVLHEALRKAVRPSNVCLPMESL